MDSVFLRLSSYTAAAGGEFKTFVTFAMYKNVTEIYFKGIIDMYNQSSWLPNFNL